MKKKLLASVLAVMASALVVACQNGAVSDNALSVSDMSVSEAAISDNSVSANEALDAVSENSVSDNEAVSDNSIIEEEIIEEEIVEEPVEEYEILYTIEDIANMDTANMTAEEYVELYTSCDRETVTFIKLDNRVVEDVEALKELLRKFPNLEQVDMCDCGFNNEEMDAINQDLPDIKVVWRIRINRWSFRTDAVAFSTYQPKVITYMMNNEDAKAFKYCTDLRALDLGHNAITDYSFLQYLPELRILIVADNIDRQYGGYVKNLQYVRYCTHLQYFEFFISQVSDMSFLHDLPELKDLNLCYTKVNDLSVFKDLPNLERLWLNCCGITYDDYQQLKEWHPNATIMYGHAGSTDQGWREHSRYWAMRQSFANNYLHEAFCDPVEEEDPLYIEEETDEPSANETAGENNEDVAEESAPEIEEIED